MIENKILNKVKSKNEPETKKMRNKMFKCFKLLLFFQTLVIFPKSQVNMVKNTKSC